MKLTLCRAALGLVVYGYVLQYRAGGWLLVWSMVGLSVASHVLISASKRLG